MKRFNLNNLFLLLAIIICSAANGFSQNNPPGNQFVGENRPRLLEELGLSQDQVRQLRQLNVSLQPQMRESERNMRQAKRALDDAIYADESTDAEIQQRLEVFQRAQAEVAKNRTLMETSVRKILTREQLFKFRQLRQQFNKNQNNPNKPLQNRPLQKRLMKQGNRPPM